MTRPERPGLVRCEIPGGQVLAAPHIQHTDTDRNVCDASYAYSLIIASTHSVGRSYGAIPSSQSHSHL